MTTKVEKSGLLSIVQSLVDANPDISDQKIANVLKKDYGDKLENGTITWYAIHNVRKKLDKHNVLESIKEEDSLDDVAVQEFNRILKEGVDHAQNIYNEAKGTGELGIALKGLEQIRKNMVSMMLFYKKHIIPPIQNITINEDRKVIIQLQKYQSVLCPNCRERINREILLGNEIE